MSAALAPHLSALVQLRRDLHSHPELSYQEKRTASQVAAYLHALGLPVHQGLGTTGLVASIHGQGFSAAHPGPSVGLRADMDALPLAEATGLPYASRHPGKMHACGHDGHTAMLLGAAHLLSQQRNFAGTVHLIFQPAEEGGAGAKAMMEDGLFQRFACQAVFALHNWPDLPQGQMAVRVGPIMAANIRFEIRVRGKGGLVRTTWDEAAEIVAAAGFTAELAGPVADVIQKLWTVYREEDATLVEVNPLVLTEDGKVVAYRARVQLSFKYEG